MSSNVGIEEDEDSPSTARPPSHPHSPRASPSQLFDIATAPPPRPPSPNDLTNAKTTLSPATWAQQPDTVAVVTPTISAAPPKVHSSPRRRAGSRAESTSIGTQRRSLSKEQDGTLNAPSVASAASSSAFRVIRVPDKPSSASHENPIEPEGQLQQEQREPPQNERTKKGGVEPRKEEEEEELDKREEEEDTPPPPSLPRKRAEPILKPIPSPPWASDGFRPDDPPPPRTRAREVDGGGKSRLGVREAEKNGPGVGRSVGSSSGSGIGRKEIQAEARTTGRGPHAHAPRARGSISGGIPTPPAASGGAASRQAPYTNPYTHPYPYSSPNLQPYSNANAHPYPASYATATGDHLPRGANHAHEGSSDSGGRWDHGHEANASATHEVHRLSVSAHQPLPQNQRPRQRHFAQAPPHQQLAHQPRYAEEQRPQFHSQHPQQPPSPKRSYGTPPDQTPHPDASYSYPHNQKYQQPQPQAPMAHTSYNPAPSSPRKRTRSQSPLHLAPPPPPPWYTPAQTQAHARAFTHAPARSSMSGAVAPLRKSGSGTVLEAVARAAGTRTTASGASYASLDPSPSPSPVLARRVKPRVGSVSRNWSRSRSRGRNRSLSRGRSISRGRSRSTTDSSLSPRGRDLIRGSYGIRRHGASGSRPGPMFGPVGRRVRAGNSGSEMDVDEQYSWSRKGKGKEREEDRHHAQARRRSASLSPMREDTGANAGAASRQAHADARHPLRWADTGRLPSPDPGLRPAWEPTIRSPPALASTRPTSQAQAQGVTSPPSTSIPYEYDYAIEHSPPAPAHAMLQDENDERRDYSRHGPPPPSPAYRPLSPPPPERRTVAQPVRMRRSRSPSMERGGHLPYGPPSTRSPYYAVPPSAPMGVQSYAYLAAQPRQFLPPPPEPAPPPSLREQTHEWQMNKDTPRRNFPRGGSPARQSQHQSQHQYSRHQPLPASGRYSPLPHQMWDMPPTEEQASQQRLYHLESQQSDMSPNQQPIRLRPPPASGHMQSVHRVIVPATGPSSSTSPLVPGPSGIRQGSAHATASSSASSPSRARAFSSAQAPAQALLSPHPQWQAPQPPPPPLPPGAKHRTPRVRKPPPSRAPGMSEFDRPHPNPTVSMRTIPQPPPQLVAQQLAAQLGIPMGSTGLRGTNAPTAAAPGGAGGTRSGSPGADGSATGPAVTAGMSARSGLGGDTILPPDLQVGAHLTQAEDAARLAQKMQKTKHRQSQSGQPAGDGGFTSRSYMSTISTSTASISAAAGPSTVPPEQAPMQFGPLQHFQTTLFPQEHLLLDMHSVGGAQFVLKPPRNVKGGRGVYGSYGVVLDGVTGVPLNVGSIIGVDAGSSGERGGGAAGTGTTAAGGSGASAKNGGRKGGAGGTGGGSSASHAEPGDEGAALLHNVLVVKRRRVPGGAQELGAPDPAAGGPLVAGGRLMTPPPGEGRARGVHISTSAASATSVAVSLAAGEGRGKRGRPKGGSSWASGKGKEREKATVQDRRLSTISQALGTAEAPLTISDDDEPGVLKTSLTKNTDSIRRPSRSPDAPPIQVHVEDSPYNDALDESDSQSEEEDELESEDSNGGLGYTQAVQHTQARTTSALFSASTAAPLRQSTRTSSVPSTSRSSSDTYDIAGPNLEAGLDKAERIDANKLRDEGAQSSRAPGASGSVGEGGGTETNTFAAPARPSRKSKKYSCDVCDQIFTRSGDVRRHKDTRHNTEGGGGCHCPFCGRVLTRQDALQRHWDRYCRRKSKRHLDRSRGGQASGMGVYGLMHRSYLDPLPHSSYLGGRLVTNEDEITAAMTMAMSMVQSGGSGGSGGRASTGPSRASSPSGSHSRSSSAYGRRLPNEDEEDGEDEDRMDVDMDARSAESARAGSSRAVPNAQNLDRPNDSGMEMSGLE